MTTDDDGAPYDPELMAAVTDLGDALRGLVEASVRTTVPAAELRAVAATARAATTRLAASTRPATQLPALDDPVRFRRVYNPVTGVGSALAPPLVLREEPGGVVGEVSFGLTHEGPPGYLHGGMSGLVMDQVLGAATIRAGLWGMTARLELDYRRPVPLGTPVVCRGRVVESGGRTSVVTGSIALATEPDLPLVEAGAVFVLPREELRAAYFSEVTDASGRHAPPQRPTDATAPAPGGDR
ncbi:Acyl-coenzyme A thioesterase PaaI, contains HGG motif [Geodermatophilus saharensis]|uniref:Acyl-coenzyme A thioesterase PaaI, contains HGG motif n=1 Tax=Geodermatophilus saharensis TaxID=1137994 RepID=A0A238ZI29_9ACTN|nr:PaaI family thioesterase [Geodermatophilus saharensis]SNR83116.1 Acyl-coenzyme A thioesterase PaaI, contains HGG motif [Geodermatophilus saharensis]